MTNIHITNRHKENRHKTAIGEGELQLERPPTKVLATIAGQGCRSVEKIFRRPVDHIFCIDRMVDTFLRKIVCNDVDAPFQIHRADIRRGFKKSTEYEEAIY